MLVGLPGCRGPLLDGAGVCAASPLPVELAAAATVPSKFIVEEEYRFRTTQISLVGTISISTNKCMFCRGYSLKKGHGICLGEQMKSIASNWLVSLLSRYQLSHGAAYEMKRNET